MGILFTETMKNNTFEFGFECDKTREKSYKLNYTLHLLSLA